MKLDVKEIAAGRVAKLFKLAKEEGNIQRQRRYISLARKVAQKVRFRLPKTYKRQFCKHCSVLWSTKTVKVRLNKMLKTVEYRCLNCGKITRFPHSRKKD